MILCYLNSYTTKELKNKAILSLNNFLCIVMWSIVMYSNSFVIYCLMLHDSIIKIAKLCLVASVSYCIANYTINNDYIHGIILAICICTAWFLDISISSCICNMFR